LVEKKAERPPDRNGVGLPFAKWKGREAFDAPGWEDKLRPSTKPQQG